MPAMKWLVALATIAYSFSLVGVRAQHTEAICGAQFTWMFNSLGQSPCLVTAFLGEPCSGIRDYDVPSTSPGHHYAPSPSPSQCECTTVMYSLYSACAACQGATVDAWTNYIANCSAVGPDGSYPLSIPPGTSIPAYAFQQVETSNRFNVTQAQSTGDSPETSAAPSGTSSTSTSSSTSGSTHKSGTNIGAIIGGVIGGLAVIAIIGVLLAFFLLRKRRARKLEQEEYNDGNYATSPYPESFASPILGAANPSIINSSYYNPPLSSKPYDPNDPNTFPPTSMASSRPTTIASSTLPSVFTPFNPDSSIRI